MTKILQPKFLIFTEKKREKTCVRLQGQMLQTKTLLMTKLYDLNFHVSKYKFSNDRN